MKHDIQPNDDLVFTLGGRDDWFCSCKIWISSTAAAGDKFYPPGVFMTLDVLFRPISPPDYLP